MIAPLNLFLFLRPRSESSFSGFSAVQVHKPHLVAVHADSRWSLAALSTDDPMINIHTDDPMINIPAHQKGMTSFPLHSLATVSNQPMWSLLGQPEGLPCRLLQYCQGSSSRLVLLSASSSPDKDEEDLSQSTMPGRGNPCEGGQNSGSRNSHAELPPLWGRLKRKVDIQNLKGMSDSVSIKLIDPSAGM